MEQIGQASNRIIERLRATLAKGVGVEEGELFADKTTDAQKELGAQMDALRVEARDDLMERMGLTAAAAENAVRHMYEFVVEPAMVMSLGCLPPGESKSRGLTITLRPRNVTPPMVTHMVPVAHVDDKARFGPGNGWYSWGEAAE